MRNCLLILAVLISCCIKAQPLVIAHRGASRLEAENSIAAFEKAIEIKADYIETDVHQTKDSIVVIMHDLSVNRTCIIPEELKKKHKGKQLLIKDLTFAEFKQLRLKKNGEAPPSLDEAVKRIAGKSKLLIEIKKGSSYYPGIEKNIITIIDRNDAAKWIDIIHSFDKKSLLTLQQQKSGIKLQKLIVFKLPLSSFVFAKHLNKDNFSQWQGVNVYYKFINKRLIRKLHQQNITIYAWTVNKEKAARKLIKKGVDGIITNVPEVIKSLPVGLN